MKSKNIDVSLVLDKLKKLLNIKSDAEFSRVLGFKSERTVNAWRQRGKVDYEKIILLALENNIDLNELFSSNNIKSISDDVEKISYKKDEFLNFSSPEEEFVFFYLKREIKRGLLSIIFSPAHEFLTRCLKKIEISNKELDLNNAKLILIKKIEECKINKLIDSEIKRQKVISEIINEFSNFECYVLMKFKEHFF